MKIPFKIFLFSYCLMFYCFSSFANVKCQAVFSENANSVFDLSVAQDAWDPKLFSDPSHHNDNSFRYMVQAGPNAVEVGNKAEVFYTSIRAKNHFSIRPFFSGSIVSELHTATYDDYGVIIKVPKDRFLTAAPKDMGSFIGKSSQDIEGTISYYTHNNKLPSPADVLEQTEKNTPFMGFFHWTEVLFKGDKRHLSSKIEVTGVFAHRDSLGNVLLPDKYYQYVLRASYEMKVPLVLLPPPKGRFILSVKMKGDRKDHMPSDFFYFGDLGPEVIEFQNSKTEVMKIFDEAEVNNEPVQLFEVGKVGVSYISKSLFDGYWSERNPQRDLHSPESLPKGIKPIMFKFKPE